MKSTEDFDTHFVICVVGGDLSNELDVRLSGKVDATKNETFGDNDFMVYYSSGRIQNPKVANNFSTQCFISCFVVSLYIIQLSTYVINLNNLSRFKILFSKGVIECKACDGAAKPIVKVTIGGEDITGMQVLDKHIIVIAARKRSLGQGNVFTRVCHSIHRGKGVGFPACVTVHITSIQGGWLPIAS